jgi:hypothetical protein
VEFANVETGSRLSVLIVLVSLVTLTGCQWIGFAWQAVDPPKADKVYTLPSRPTLVLVDDPANELGSPQLATIAAVSVATDLKAHGAVNQVIDQNRVFDFAAKNEAEFARMGVANVGRAVGAQQVIHVHIRSATYLAEPGMLRPSASLLVKVIDTSKPKGSRKLFPPVAEAAAGLPIRDGAYVMTVSLRHKVSGGDSRSQMAVIRQKLADKIGAEVAKLFYNYELGRPGASFED